MKLKVLSQEQRGILVHNDNIGLILLELMLPGKKW